MKPRVSIPQGMQTMREAGRASSYRRCTAHVCVPLLHGLYACVTTNSGVGVRLPGACTIAHATTRPHHAHVDCSFHRPWTLSCTHTHSPRTHAAMPTPGAHLSVRGARHQRAVLRARQEACLRTRGTRHVTRGTCQQVTCVKWHAATDRDGLEPG